MFKTFINLKLLWKLFKKNGYNSSLENCNKNINLKLIQNLLLI